MGILSKISENDHSARLEKQQPCDKQSLLARIRKTYPAATVVATDAVRADGAAQDPPRPREPRPFAVAACMPGELPAFDPCLSQAERRDIQESLDWFDRMDARVRREAVEAEEQVRKKQVKSNTLEIGVQ